MHFQCTLISPIVYVLFVTLPKKEEEYLRLRVLFSTIAVDSGSKVIDIGPASSLTKVMRIRGIGSKHRHRGSVTSHHFFHYFNIFGFHQKITFIYHLKTFH